MKNHKGHNNRDRRYVKVTKTEKKTVKRAFRNAIKRETKGEHLRGSGRARERGWWYA